MKAGGIRGAASRSSLASEGVAVIGMACRFPGAPDYRAFWENLRMGVNSIREIPSSRWSVADYWSADPDRPNSTVSKWCGVVDGVEEFDADFFRVSPREARSMDPQQRLLLQEAYRCIEDAGIHPGELREGRTASLIGSMANDYQQILVAPGLEIDSYAALGNYDCILANRVSHFLGLDGPSITLDAACASSLVALDRARRMLLAGECGFALVAGVSLNLHPWKYISFSKSRMLSPDGQCRPFDRFANGYVPGDGIAVLLLRREEDARRAGNRIHGVVRGSAVNQTRGTATITAPDPAGQQALIAAALAEAGAEPSDLGYVEAHGTGTSLGDPIEFEALSRVFAGVGRGRCGLGSVKANIGHLEAAAGLAGVIKVLLMMRHGAIPPQVNFGEANPIIPLEGSPFAITTAFRPWIREGVSPLRAGVSSFGFGGACAHAILEEALPEPGTAGDTRKPETQGSLPFLITARTPAALETMRGAWRSFLATGEAAQLPVDSICRTLAGAREHMAYRIGALVASREDLAFVLDAPTSGGPPSGLGLALRGDEPDPWSSPCLSAILPGLVEEAVPPEAAQRLPGFAHGAALIAAGANPAAISGCGEGVLAALALCGILTPAEALTLARGGDPGQAEPRRPRIPWYDPLERSLVHPLGADVDCLASLLAGLRVERGELAALADKALALIDHQFTFRRSLEAWDEALRPAGTSMRILLEKASAGSLAGGEAALAALPVLAAFRHIGRKWSLTEIRPLACEEAYELVDLLQDGVLDPGSLAGQLLSGGAPGARLQQAWRDGQHRLDPAKPYPRIRRESRFRPAGGFVHWLRSLQGLESVSWPEGIRPLSLAGRTRDSARDFLEILMDAWRAGAPIRWERFFPPGEYAPVDLPAYPFERRRFPLPGREAGEQGSLQRREPSSIRPGPVRVKRGDWIADHHVLDGVPIVPGTAFLAAGMGLHAGGAPGGDILLEDVEFLSPLPVEEEVAFEAEPLPDGAGFACRSGAGLHMRARLRHSTVPAAPMGVAQRADVLREADSAAIYAAFARRGYAYGERFRVLRAVRETGDAYEADLEPAATGFSGDAGFLDGFLQAVLAAEFLFRARGREEAEGLYLPSRIGRLRIPKEPARAYRLRLPKAAFRSGEGRLCADLDAAGTGTFGAAASGRDLEFTRVLTGHLAAARPHPGSVLVNRTLSWAEAPSGGAEWEGETLAFLPRGEPTGIVEGLEGVIRVLPGPAFRRLDRGLCEADMDTMEGVAAVLREFPDAARVLYMAGDALGGHPTGSAGLVGAARRVLVPLFHLAQALAAIPRPMGFLLLTEGCQSVAGERMAFPLAASAMGLAKVLAHENPGLWVRCVDAEAGSWTDAGLLRRETADSPAPIGEAAYRKGRRYARRLADASPSATLPAPGAGRDADGFREGGTYLVVGGAGGLGAETCRRLAGRRARLVLVGRRPSGKAVEALLAELRELGGDSAYFQGDVRDLEGLRVIAAEARRRFGGIHGFIHSAVAPADARIADLDWGAFSESLSTKLTGSWALSRVAEEEGAELLLFYSSVLTLRGGPGAAGYVAACAFQDHLAECLALEKPIACRSIQWGYWGRTGLDEAGRLEGHLASLGIHPLTPRDRAAGFAIAEAVKDPRFVSARLERGVLEALRGLPGPVPESSPAPSPRPAVSEPGPEDIRRMLLAIWREAIENPTLGMAEDFTDAGGDSLNGAQILSRVQQRLGVAIRMDDIYDHPTVEALARKIQALGPVVGPGPSDQGTAEHRAPEPALPARVNGLGSGPGHPLSESQRHLWILQRLAPVSPAYNLSQAHRLSGRLDIPALRWALTEVFRRHAALRSRVLEGAEPRQTTDEAFALPLVIHDLVSLPDSAREVRAGRILEAEAREPFDLSTAPVARCALVRLAEEEHILVLTVHHLFMDGYSVALMNREIRILYAARKGGRDHGLNTPPPGGFLELLPAIAARQAATAASQLEFWRSRLEGLPARIRLPADLPRPRRRLGEGENIRFSVDPGTARAVADLAKSANGSAYMVLLATFAAQLSKWSGSEDLAVGTAVANRSLPGMDRVMGPFVNTLAVRTRVERGQAFRAMVERMKRSSLDAFSHADIPFERLVQELGSKDPWFRTLFILQGEDTYRLELEGAFSRLERIGTFAALFDLSVEIWPSDGGYEGTWEYATDLFTPEAAGGMLTEWLALVRRAVANPDEMIGSL